MKHTLVELPDVLSAELEQEAQRRNITVSELTREAVEAFLRPDKRRKLFAAGAGRSGNADNSERIEEILRKELRPS